MSHKFFLIFREDYCHHQSVYQSSVYMAAMSLIHSLLNLSLWIFKVLLSCFFIIFLYFENIKSGLQ